MSKYIKKKIENLQELGTDETLFASSRKSYYKTPWWKFWERRKLQYETSKSGITREFDRKGNLVSISDGEDTLDVKTKVITRTEFPYGGKQDAKKRILRTFPNGKYEETNYFASGEKRVLKGNVDDKGVYYCHALVIFDATGRQVEGRWSNDSKVVAKGKLKEVLQKGLSAGALEEKARQLEGLKGADRLKRSKELYSQAHKEMKNEQARAKFRQRIIERRGLIPWW